MHENAGFFDNFYSPILSVSTGRVARTGRAQADGPEARRAFEVGPRAVLKIAKISEIMAKLGVF